MSTVPRLHVDAPLAEGAPIALETDAARYLVTVLRRRPGDAVRVFNGRDGEWRARLAEAGKRAASLVVETRLRAQAASPDLHLLFAPVKKARTDFIVEKATELGVSALRPVMTRRTIAERVRTDRMQALAREAAEQTERLDLPLVREAESLEAALSAWDGARRLIFADEAGDDPDAPWGGEPGRARPMLEALSGAAPSGGEAPGPWAILIGPEGGFDPEERDRLRAADFVVPVTLGPRILRADTAAAAALALWQAALGDWGRGVRA